MDFHILPYTNAQPKEKPTTHFLFSLQFEFIPSSLFASLLYFSEDCKTETTNKN